MKESLRVRLDEVVYDVERPFGDLPAGAGIVSDVAVDTRGHIFVLLRRDPLLSEPGPAVVELAPDGSRVRAWGVDIADAHMLVCDPVSGDVLVVDRDAHQVRRYTSAGQYLGGLGTRHAPGEPFSHPTDIAVMPDGQLIVTDGYGNAHAHVFSADGQLLRSIGQVGNGQGQFLSPHSVCALDEEHFVVADRENHRLVVVHRNGEQKACWYGFFRPQSVWRNRAGQILVMDAIPSLSLVSPTGERISRCRPVLNGAHGLCGNLHTGEIFLAEGNPSRVTRLRPIG